MKYDFQAIEAKWQAFWDRQQTFRSTNPGEDGFDPNQRKFYVLDMFPYPSGVGLHVGHPLGYIATDIVARYRRMCGEHVLHPMGFDAFGLPAEQFAVEHGVHPRTTTEQNIANMVRQLKGLGLSYDWSRKLATTDEGYYRWTQWIFLKLYESWFDPWANAARPIAQLRRKLESGELDVGPDGELIPVAGMGSMDTLGGPAIGARKWHELAPEQRRRLLDEYRLAYIDEVEVNWCPALGTVLANEEVTAEGRSERANHPVYQRPMQQWMLRITAMADRLADDLDLVDWPEPIKRLQRNWIGRSEGAEVEFPLADRAEPEPGDAGPSPANEDEPAAAMPGDSITVFTTRPDTLFGATYMVLAPEHPLVDELVNDTQRDAVQTYRREAARKTELDRQAEAKEKTGVFTGGYAINPVHGERVPVWIADYVMMGYGTGAIMAVPAHDERDHAFARAFDLPIVEVVQAPEKHDIQAEAWTGEGVNVRSANEEISLNGLETEQAKDQIIDWLERKGLGRRRIQYKLRDWLFSRQRYWGEPFPILHELDEAGKRTGRTVAVAEDQLPVTLPPMDDFRPEGGDDPNAPVRPPLARAPEGWRVVEIDGVRYERELNTMPQWAGSCWYYLRFCDPHNDRRFVGERAERYWMAGHAVGGHDEPAPGPPASASGSSGSAGGGVDLYVGGVEHAVLHLLYARFWHKVLGDLGFICTPEPFAKLFNQGYIQAYAYTDARGVYVPADEVVDQNGRPAMEVQDQPDRQFFYKDEPVTQEFGKMGKSLKNALAPDDVCREYGCDTLRLYEMYMGPLEQSKVWNTRDIVGVHRFLQRLWRNFIDEQSGELLIDNNDNDNDDDRQPLRRAVHKTIARVTDAMDRMSFNTAIAALIELNNKLVPLPRIPREAAETIVLLLAPFAPHVCEELWQKLRADEPHGLAYAPWPEPDPDLLVDEQIEYPVQVKGKLRGRITVPADADEDTITQAALADEAVKPHLGDAPPRKVIVVPRKMVNIVPGG